MSTWVIPYIDQDLDFWQQVAGRFGPVIEEVYFPLPEHVARSGRNLQPSVHLEEFLRSAPLPKSVLVNPIVLSRPVEEIGPRVMAMLQQLHDDYGVQKVVVANLTLARLIREVLPFFTITASVLMGISTPAQALVARDVVDVIVPDTRLARDKAGLQRLREAVTGRICLIVNESCIPGCLYRMQHFYEMGYGDWFPESLCGPMLEAHPWLRLTGAWILPRHLHHYDGLADHLKLAGRVTLRNPDDYFRVLGAYVHRQDILPCDIGGGPASVLEPIDIPDDLFEFTFTCDKNCHRCSVCQNYYERAARAQQARCAPPVPAAE
jgi:hypothetical protein